MAAHFIQDEPYLTKDRVINLTLPDLVVCSLCQGILWLPIACKFCEKPFCSSCMEAWKLENSKCTACPNNCPNYVERLCPQANNHVLGTLQVTCRYQPNGCTETLPYNNLETHEEACGYRPIICSGCDKAIVRKDFNEHYNTCPLVLITCTECNSVYERQHESQHTELKCLRVQLNQVRELAKQNQEENKYRLNSLESQIIDFQGIIQQLR
jgi:hypothetical protein